MVLKLGKGGVKTGKKLTASPSKWHLQEYRKDCCLVRKIKQGSHSQPARKLDPALGSIDVPEDNVPFSLNKKGRWLLPGLLRQHILSEDHADEDFGIQLIEYKKVNRQDNCVAYHATWGPVREAHAKEEKGTSFETSKMFSKRPYISAYNLTCSTTKASQEEPGRFPDFMVEHGEDEPAFIPTNLQYHVVYPASDSNATIYSGSCMSQASKRTGWYWYRTRPRRNRRGYDREGRRFPYWLEDTLDIQEIEDEIISKNQEDSSQVSNRTTLCLQDFVNHQSCSSKKWKHKRTSSVNSTNPKAERERKVVYIDKDDIDSVSSERTVFESIEVKVPSFSTTKPVHVVFPYENVRTQVLEEHFGASYTECDCYPRKFLLDISEQVMAAANKKSSSTENIAFIVFSRVDNDEQKNIYGVTLNMEVETAFSDYVIDTLFSNSEYTVDEVVRNTMFFIETLPDSYFSFPVKPVKIEKRLKEKRGVLGEVNGWKSVSYFPKDRDILKKFLPERDRWNILHEPNDVRGKGRVSNTPSPKEQVGLCNICYESFESATVGTALRGCCHWFCDNCWRQHLWTTVSSGRSHLDCPELDCEEEVDLGTLIALMDIDVVLKHVRNRHDCEVTQAKDTKWCPKPECGCVLKVTAEGQKEVACKSGADICFECLGDSHWPVPCSVQRAFVRKLKENGHHDIFSYNVPVNISLANGKHCPHCNQFIEKNGGCPFMNCRCGKNFCWGCMRDWNTAKHDSNCYKNGSLNDFETETIELQDVERFRAPKHRWYNSAVFHMSQQHQSKVVELKKSLHILNNRMGNRKRHQVVEALPLLFPREYSTDFQKLQYVMKNILDLYQNLLIVIARGAILMDTVHGLETKKPALAYHLHRLESFAMIMSNLLTPGSLDDPRHIVTNVVELGNRSRLAIIRAISVMSSFAE